MARAARIEKFRQKYQAEMAPSYNPWLHMGFMWGTATLIIMMCAGKITDGGWFWLALIPVFLGLNFLEWWVHKYVMHQKINFPGFIDLYERHTYDHHRYFTDTEMTFDHWREMRVIAFPWQAMVAFVVGGIVVGSLAAGVAHTVGVAQAETLGFIILLGFTVYYLLFDVMHVSTHFEDNVILRHTPFINTLRRLHSAHHKTKNMTALNMNLTFPVADYIMGTSDLDRGFWGTLFNGYSEEHIKCEEASLDVQQVTPEALTRQG